MKPLVAVTQRVDIYADRSERRDALDQSWCDYIEAGGGCPLPLPNNRRSAMNLVESLPVKALILSGGNDIMAVGGDAPERDETERALVDWARRRKRPILAICRGMQFLAHLFGGKLAAIPGHVAVRHMISTTQGKAIVNSFHNWCVTALPPGFRTVATAPDGTIESMIHETEAITAIMWHPEREPAFSLSDLALLAKCLEDCT